ncbi:TetR/AcrR family transcriptional regulator [Spirochaeta isovalerica]|uniref:TetR/AcrR family transcriptional regulator of autoinduction and epiphytic fitness n=1 Tax=Spirochaeta isovalerica TaxID=150 RepID=A0A841RDS2_9SPIO|nr:TetR/AcrR family transcriptional regulator [Spirochaeta isovalerica]MBB6481776.1 TetR/AcrR family transcriptional regulator of autoinduction and epiphytic fitness [Spirochaeta isovalerica]
MNKERKKRDTSRKHKLILDSAIDLFGQKGYEAVSMDEIAETAHVSKRTVYNHFQSKEKLFQEIVEIFVAQSDLKKPLDYSPSIPIREQLESFVRAAMHMIDDPRRRSLSKLLTSVFIMDPLFCRQTYSAYSPHKALINWLKDAGADGRIRCASPELAAKVFYGLVEGCITWNALMSEGISLADIDPVIDELIEVFLSRYGADSLK